MKILYYLLIPVICLAQFSTFPKFQDYLSTSEDIIPLLELDGTNYDATAGVWTNTGSIADRDGIEQGTCLKNETPPACTFPQLAANFIRSESFESDGGLLLETGTIEIAFSLDDFNTASALFSISDTAVATTSFWIQVETDESISLYNRDAGTWDYDISIGAGDWNSTAIKWHHLVWQIDETGINPMRVFIDDTVRTLTKTVTTDTTQFINNAALTTNKARVKYAVGLAYDSTPSAPMDGFIGVVRIYNTYLTAAQINSLYNELDAIYNFGD